MPSKKETIIQEEPKDTAIVLQEETALAKPENDTKFAHEAAKFLMDIVKQNNWSRKLGGQSEHLQYEAWQTAGKFYGYSVKTFEAEYVELGGTWGFKAKACVVNEKTGIQVGGAEAYCMSDEYNWKAKPKFQLASMAQTRAGSKALRQILGFVVALAGYNPTPAEEMDSTTIKPAYTPQPAAPRDMTTNQKIEILRLCGRLNNKVENLNPYLKQKFQVNTYDQLKYHQAEMLIKGLNEKIAQKQAVEPDVPVNVDDIPDDLGTK